ncbi:ABC transporter substrate-binding protein [Streptomyces sp. NBC_01387]|uniref:ABC transporter substrate-binding protein n=1 Tax=unclassified Streptomyces TaxID=2593676 RepID=UPI002024B4C1|nr:MULTISPECIES: ABC transporter substrate-binding protein [unclassified Streptomyces]MCX4553724.1 ABC transporter substrate-binding protein [Streptomyces sp. NBC_01500]WSC18648.1 ABC transporter substrate-binding protein [Streptomyces sp. NBC_01766]WSV52682.1 ABC transporter substrate-binding protein [Streptomyces sp. NBC_01014]
MSRTTALLACSAVIAAAAGCSGATTSRNGGSAAPAYTVTPNSPAAKGSLDSFTWSLYAEPYTLDYALAYDYPPNTVLANVCEQLLRVTPDMKIAPGLAVKYTNPDPKTWVYTLRPGVKFHDGSTMTADDVVASLKRQMNPATGSPWGSTFKNVSSIRKSGPLEVTIRLSKPDVLLNELMAASPGTIESAAYLAKAGKEYGGPKGGVDCTGPYKLDHWAQGDSITLKKNNAYWDRSLTPKTGTVKFTFTEDPSARTNAFLSGTADGGYLVPSSAFNQLRTSSKGKLYFGPNTGASDLAVLNLKGTLGNLKVRQALSMAIDRKNIIKAAAGGIGVPSKAPAARGAWALTPKKKADEYFKQLPEPVYDVAAAKKLITEAGATGHKVTVVTSSMTPEISVVANAVQAAGKQIGLDVRLKAVAPDAYTSIFVDPGARKGLDLVITNGYDNTPDPLEFYQYLRTGDFGNYGNWSNAEFDALFDKANAEPDPARRAELTAELQRITVRELPIIPLYEAPYSVFLGNRISGAATGIAQLYYPWAATIGAAQ